MYTIIACSKEGQLCNRLFHFSHFIANALENKLELHYLFFDEYLRYFDENLTMELLKNNIKIKSSFFRKILLNIFARFAPNFLLTSQSYIILRSPRIVDLKKLPQETEGKSYQILAHGWLFRDYQNFKKHADQIRKFFAFRGDISKKVSEKISPIKSPNSVLVGVHIRRGDYKKFQNGKYFFSDECYLDKINQLKNIFMAQNKTSLFLVTSDDPNILKNQSYRLPNVRVFNGNPIESLCALSMCDYLIGPPSTFSSWASFYGKVPLQFLESKDQKLAFNLFQVNCG